MKIIVNLVLSVIAVLITARMLPGITLDGFGTALKVAVLLGLVNAVLRPVIMILTLPINMLTLGAFTFVIIGGLVQLVSHLLPGFHVANFLWGLAFAFVLWIISAVLSIFKS